MSPVPWCKLENRFGYKFKYGFLWASNTKGKLEIKICLAGCRSQVINTDMTPFIHISLKAKISIHNNPKQNNLPNQFFLKFTKLFIVYAKARKRKRIFTNLCREMITAHREEGI